PWMPDRTEANPNELNQDDARYGFRCCHLKNIWTAPLPPETELSRQMTTSTTSIDIMDTSITHAYSIVIGSKHITLNATGGGFLTASKQFRHGATSKSRSNTASNSTKHKSPHLSGWRQIIS